jgi:hypothetical protein
MGERCRWAFPQEHSATYCPTALRCRQSMRSVLSRGPAKLTSGGAGDAAANAQQAGQSSRSGRPAERGEDPLREPAGVSALRRRSARLPPLAMLPSERAAMPQGHPPALASSSWQGFPPGEESIGGGLGPH